MQIHPAPNLTDQVYDAIVDEICDGRLAPGMHLVQEQLAERYGISRQPIQQAMARLKADGMVEELGRRGLFVTRLNPDRMLQHYGVRAALDGYAARVVAERAFLDPAFADTFRRDSRSILDAGQQAVKAGSTSEQIRLDDALHQLIYARTGNPMIATTAEPHWRFLRRAMSAVLHHVATPGEIWRQHADLVEAIISADAREAERQALGHVEQAARLLADAATTNDPNGPLAPDTTDATQNRGDRRT